MRKYATPIFQHRHYAAIAKVLSEQTVSRDILDALASMFANDNPHFQSQRFHAAARGVPINGRDRRDEQPFTGKDRDEWKHEAAQAMRLKR